ncbi:MAG: UbiA-like protein EboC [Ginsengibacter sp.]
MKKSIAYYKLLRPANIITAIADVLAGVAIAGYFADSAYSTHAIFPVVLLCFSTIGLYGGGVVFNDVFDATLDKIERPERPIPMGIVSVKEGAVLGCVFLLMGIIAAFMVNYIAGLLAAGIAVFALVYDKWGKHASLLGPLNMGLCRGLNLLLGVSIIVSQVQIVWYVAIVPIIYIASITMISRGEVHGGKSSLLYFGGFLYTVVVLFVLYFSISKNEWLLSLLFIVPFVWMIFRPLINAVKDPVGKNIGKAVKAGVIAIILLNASWAAAFGSPWLAVLIILLLPLSLYLGKKFAVT